MRIKNKDVLSSHGNTEGRKIVSELLDAGLDSIDPYLRVKKLMEVKEGNLIFHTEGFEMKEFLYFLTHMLSLGPQALL